MGIDIFLAEQLLTIESIKVNVEKPFQWASGWKSPIYCDNRKILAYPKIRNIVVESFCNEIKNNFSNTELIAGVATAGIAWGALIAHELNLPFCYVRPQPKSHGLAKQVEGDYKANQKVIVIEDLISTGKSSIKVIQVLKDLSLQVNGLLSIFNYGFDEAVDAFKNANVTTFSLSNFNALIQKAMEQNIIKNTDITIINQWRKNPSEWSI